MANANPHNIVTPPHFSKVLGPFDLDPCAPKVRPWPTARNHYSIEQDGLGAKWEGRIWLNPPFGIDTEFWLAKLSAHGNGVALVFARTDTEMFFRHVWPRAHAVMFIKHRIKYHTPNGKVSKEKAGLPSMLIAYGSVNAVRLRASRLGHFVRLKI
jgi:hypothetical protein